MMMVNILLQQRITTTTTSGAYFGAKIQIRISTMLRWYRHGLLLEKIRLAIDFFENATLFGRMGGWEETMG